MMDNSDLELKDIDSGDISDVLRKIEKSFDFEFEKNELKDVKTFGELCDVVTNKVQGQNTEDCTSQQAFYKLREALSTTLNIEKSSITPDTDLKKLYPKRNRRKKIKSLEPHLGYKIKILRPKYWVSYTLEITTIVSFILLFIFWKFGFAGIVIPIVGINIATRFGKELEIKTVGQALEKIVRENYVKARRHPTVNKNEIANKIKNLFSKELELNEHVLTREASFI